MRNPGGNKNKWLSVLESKPVLFVLFLVVLAFAWSVFGFMGKMSDTRKNRQLVQARVAELQKEHGRLSADISKLSTEEGMEHSIREKFGFAKEGEELIVVVEDQSKKGEEEKKNSRWFSSFFSNLFR